VRDRESIDVLLVSPGTTAGWRRADSELVRVLEELGVSVAVCSSSYRLVRHLRRSVLTTDLAEAAAMRRAVTRGLRRHRPRAIVYSSSQAAMLQPRSRLEGSTAVRFDVPAAVNRSGFGSGLLHALERRVVRKVRVLLPIGVEAGPEAQELARGMPVVPLPIPIDLPAQDGPARDPIALAYAGNPEKKGLDLVAGAWARGAPRGWRLVVTGIDRDSGRRFLRRRGLDDPPGIEWAGRLEPGPYRELLSSATVFISASRYEDYGLAQLEALALGTLLVTAPSDGPYQALAIQRRLDPSLVAVECSADALAAALAAAFSFSEAERRDLQRRARAHLEPYSRGTLKQRLERDALPLLLESDQT
jgi:glycosyltransferase involved in cell wall biosynthesis